MSDPNHTDPRAQPPSGGDRRPLDRAPGERYGAGSGASRGGFGGAGDGQAKGAGPGPRGARALIAAVLVADAGAVVFFLLGLPDLGVGLVAVAAFTGWATALALVWWGRDAIPAARTRVAAGALLGGWSVAGGILLDWIYALLQGGVLGPPDYVAQRYGLVALLALVVGAGVAAVRAR
jgi:hypothetical protein